MSKYLILLCFVCSLLYGSLVFAQGGEVRGTQGGEESIPLTAELKNPLGDNVVIFDIVANIIKTILGLVGVAALVMFIYGGILWMTSAGNAQRIEKGRETLTWATIGLVVIFASYALVNLILKAFEVG